MKTAAFDYELPSALIAALPAERRDASRLCVFDRATGACAEARFGEIGDHLRAGDLLVVNRSRVIPARLWGHRRDTGGRVEALLVAPESATDWLCLCHPAKKMLPGERLIFGEGRMTAEVVGHRGEGMRLIRFAWEGEWWDVIDTLGETPLPPYVIGARRERESLPADLAALDRERYQTVYAAERGSVAAPTAGLHFTRELIERLRAAGVEWAEVTLHVGPGTFRPVATENIEDHHLHMESFTLGDDAAAAINAARAEGRRVIAVGTTTVRVLESCGDDKGRVAPRSGATEIFIHPGCALRTVDAMITNFHLPRSSLLMLVCAFAGTDATLAAYRWAVAREFRFYSYGDAMLIV